MNALTDPLKEHHKHCDGLFADAEAAVLGQDWATGAAALRSFISELETHFGTEEEVLFPAFEAATGMTVGPTQVMRYEHAQMRELLERMRAALENRDGRAFAGAAETLLIVMQQHNMKEEGILYPLCDSSLAGRTGELGGTLRERLHAATAVA